MNRRPVWLGKDRRGWDHVRIHIQLVDDERTHGIDLALYLLIARHAENTSGQTEKTQSWLAEKLQVSERTVRSSISRLRELEYLATEGGGGRSRAHTYFLLPPPDLNAADIAGNNSDTRQQTRQESTRIPFKEQEIDKQRPNGRSNKADEVGGILPILTDEDLRLREHLAGIDPSLPTDRAQPKPSPNPKGAEQARRAAKELH